MLVLHEVQSEQDEEQAWQLIREYLDWLNACLQQDYQLHLDVADMIADDRAEAEKFMRLRTIQTTGIPSTSSWKWIYHPQPSCDPVCDDQHLSL